ncbi:MAG: hypothetical protein ACOVNY_12370 [Chitinophagaceae bacterium]
MTVSIIEELLEFLQKISPDHYTKNCSSLSNASIGQHVRHTIEMYQCVHNGYADGLINYASRKRDYTIETSVNVAIDCLQAMKSQLYLSDKMMYVQQDDQQLYSSYSREMLYCDEHAIHHLALIRIGVNEIGGYILDSSFGVAPSTLKYRASCVQ